MNPILAAIQAKLAGGHAAPPAGIPPEMAAAVHSGVPAGSPAGLPPELMAAIQGGDAEEAPEHEQNEVQLLTKIIDDIQTFLKVAADEDDKAVLATCLAQIQKLRAKDQAEMDGASQGKVTPRAVRKAAAGGGNGGY